MPPTLLIGRNTDVAAAMKRLDVEGVHLLTLVGPPGVDKIRLGIDTSTKLQKYVEKLATNVEQIRQVNGGGG